MIKYRSTITTDETEELLADYEDIISRTFPSYKQNTIKSFATELADNLSKNRITIYDKRR